MNPDEAKLALWLDDELVGEELATFEAREVTPERLEARERVRGWRRTVAKALPESEEPPYSDFFNSRISRSIREGIPAEPVKLKKQSLWSSWLLPAAACAGMVFAFWVGKASSVGTVSVAASPSGPASTQPVVYTPDGNVNAEWFSSASASATVIVLQGVTAIPDSTDLSESVYVPVSRESDSTAGSENPSREIGR